MFENGGKNTSDALICLLHQAKLTTRRSTHRRDMTGCQRCALLLIKSNLMQGLNKVKSVKRHYCYLVEVFFRNQSTNNQNISSKSPNYSFSRSDQNASGKGLVYFHDIMLFFCIILQEIYSNQWYSMLQLTQKNCDNKGEHVTVDKHVCITFMKTTQGFILVTVSRYQNNSLIILDKHQTILFNILHILGSQLNVGC